MSEKKVDKKLYEFGHLWKRSAYQSEDLANGVMENLDKLLKFYDRSMAKIVQIRRNSELTAQGKVAAFKKLKDDLAKELADLEKPMEGYAEEARRIERDAIPTRHPKDDAVWELRQREVRDHLRGLDPADAEAAFLSAAEAGNSEILSAVLYSPLPFRFATAALVAKVSRQEWEREHPEHAARLHDLQTAHSEAISAMGSVKAELARQGVETRGQDLSAVAAA